MNVEKCKALLRENKLDELLDTLENEMSKLYKVMLDYCDVKYEEDWSLSKLGNEIIKKYHSYFNTVMMCENVLYSGEYNFGDSIDILIDSYYEMSKHYKERVDKDE